LMSTQTRTMSTVDDMWVAGTIDFNAAVPCRYTPVGTIIHNVP
jgi:hypothetical protein